MTSRDPGLQPERTQLAWRRTGWSMLIPGLLCWRGWSHYGDPLYALSATLLLLGALMMFCNIHRRSHSLVASLVVVSAGVLFIKMGLHFL